MASLIPLSFRKPPTLTPKEVLYHEMQNYASRLCHLNGFVRDVALFILAPMLEYPLRGYTEPRVFSLNHTSTNEESFRKIGLQKPSSTSCLNLTRGISSINDLLFDCRGRTIIVGYPEKSLSIFSENSSEVKSVQIPSKSAFVHLNSCVIDHLGNIYAVDSYAEAIAVISSEGVFEKNIVEVNFSENGETRDIAYSIKGLAIDDLDNLYVGLYDGNTETTIVKYNLNGEKLETFNCSIKSFMMCLCFDPKYNRLYVLSSRSVDYYCFNEKLLKEFIPFSKGATFVKIKVDVEGNVYINNALGQILIYNKDGNLLSILLINTFSTPFALNENGGLCVYDGFEGIKTYDDESIGYSC